MGICLDTEQNNEESEGEEGSSGVRSAWAAGGGRSGPIHTPPTQNFPMQNESHVKFEAPRVPVIFVLGGPGSGKVTHCDTLVQERRGLVHINMTDLLQQYAIGNAQNYRSQGKDINDMQDFATLSSKTVTEVLMLEMKMAPTATTYLVSGYPRSMRDIAEYSDKIQVVNGVVLVAWRQRVLERQIDYGAKLGHVVLSLAKMELNNFYKNVMPVADYFEQSNMLIAVNGERNPEEVYKDFRTAILQILSSLEDQTAAANGVTGVGVGTGGIPGEIVGIEATPNVQPSALNVAPVPSRNIPPPDNVKKEVIRVGPAPAVGAARGKAVVTIWVVGGPGSNKAALCARAVADTHAWTHFSLGQRLRALADSGGGPRSDGALCRAALSGGDLAPGELVSKLVRDAVQAAARTGQGLVLDGYPRDLDQMATFEKEWAQQPRMVLLDCSKLQLGRGRRDDSVAAFRRRLELFREVSLPMLKQLDAQARLVIVDGDTDTAAVQAEFVRVLREEMRLATQADAATSPFPRNTHEGIGRQLSEAVHRLGAVSSLGMNGAPPHAAVTLPNATTMLPRNLPNGNLPNGFLPMHSNKVTPAAGSVTKIPTISQRTQDPTRDLYQATVRGLHDTHM